MTRKISMATWCAAFAFAFTVPLMAATANVAARVVPQVESAVAVPWNVEMPSAPAPDIQLRLQNPGEGGVLNAGESGTALLLGPTGEASFTARVAIEFLEANTVVEIRVVDAGGNEINSLSMSSPAAARWSGDLCQIDASQGARVDVAVKSGRALGTAYRTDQSFVTAIPILRLSELKTARGGTAALATSAGRRALVPGTSNYSFNHQNWPGYSWPGTSVSFVVADGPANTCGDLHTYRNGSSIVATGWLCTNANGSKTNGPWNITSTYPGYDQTDRQSYIQWPDGTQTTQTWSVIDVTAPTVSITHVYPTPNWLGFQDFYGFYGTASDGQWGSLFNSSWTTVKIYIKDESTGLYWSGSSGYVSSSPVTVPAVYSLPSGGTDSFFWSTSTSPMTIYTCPAGHHCSVTTVVNDVWTTGTATWLWQ